MENTYETLNQNIQDTIYCSLIDSGLTPGEAYELVNEKSLAEFLSSGFVGVAVVGSDDNVTWNDA